MTVLWDRSVDHEVRLGDLVGDRLEEDVVDTHALQVDQLVENQGDHQEAWDLGQDNHPGTVEVDHEEVWEVYPQKLQGH